MRPIEEGSRCPYCNRIMRNRTAKEEQHGTLVALMPTCDHILPRSRKDGDFDFRKSAINNVKIVCFRCNSLRASCGDCIGAMAAVLTLTQDVGDFGKPFRLARLWFCLRRDTEKGRARHDYLVKEF